MVKVLVEVDKGTGVQGAPSAFRQTVEVGVVEVEGVQGTPSAFLQTVAVGVEVIVAVKAGVEVFVGEEGVGVVVEAGGQLEKRMSSILTVWDVPGVVPRTST